MAPDDAGSDPSAPDAHRNLVRKLESANEELQSSNEELETAKEEMQSLNEELQTVNGELRAKVEELSLAYDDMKNLLDGTDIATLFLDKDLRIKRFTEQAKKIIHLIPSDVGRPIADLVQQLHYDQLIVDVTTVLRTLAFKESEVQAADGTWFLMRILPYRTTENVVDGVVMTFVDVTAIKQVQLRERRVVEVLEASATTAFGQDAKLAYAWVTGNVFGKTEKETLGRTDGELIGDPGCGGDRLHQATGDGDWRSEPNTGQHHPGGHRVQVRSVRRSGNQRGNHRWNQRNHHGAGQSGVRTDQLRARAEAELQEAECMEGVLHELRVHQVELELQNEELRRTQEELQASRDQWLSLYELAPIAFVTLDPRGRIRGANACALDLLNATNLTGRPLAAFMDQPAADALHLHLERTRMTGARTECEICLRDRSVRLVSTTAAPDGFLTALIDLTERKKTERSLRRHEARLAAIMQTGPDAILAIDEDGVISDVSCAAASMFGFASTDQLAGRKIELLMDSAEMAHETERFETMGRRRDRSAFPLEVRAGDAHFAGQPFRVLFLRDLTTLRENERRLEEALTRFHLLAEQIEDAFYIIDARCGRALYLSPAFRKVFGRSSMKNMEERLAFVHADDRAKVEEAYENFERGDPFDVEYRIEFPDNQIRVIHDRAFFVQEHGLITGVARDITDERRLEEQLVRAQKLEAVGTLAAGIAHDFNNLLMGLGGCAQVALRKLTSTDPARNSIEQIVEASKRGVTLTRQLLEFTRKRSSRPEPIELDLVVNDAKRLLDSMLLDDVAVEVETDASARVLADPGELEQILINLAKNAQDAMPDGGTLTLKTRLEELSGQRAQRLGLCEGTFAVLTVRDTGTGMDEATMSRIFEPFFSTKDIGEGTGLGLATTFGIVRRLSGHIDVDSRPDAGTTFTIRLPVTDHQRITTDDLLFEPTPEGTILVVEDERIVRIAARASLEELGYEVVTANGAAEAERIVEQIADRLEAVLIDVMMPGRSGNELAHALRERRAELRILFMSAHDKTYLVEHGRLTEDDILVEKPFGSAEVAAALAQDRSRG